jgi:ABC-type uncharacterized transport system auxiliary subunit
MKQMNQQLAISRNFASLTVAALLAGCGIAPPATQIVEVPVHTPCVKDVPVAPVYEFDKLAQDALAGDKVLALARDWTRGRLYEGKLTIALSGCVN